MEELDIAEMYLFSLVLHQRFNLLLHARHLVYKRCIAIIGMCADYLHGRHNASVVLLQDVLISVELEAVMYSTTIGKMMEVSPHLPTVVLKIFLAESLRTLPIYQDEIPLVIFYDKVYRASNVLRFAKDLSLIHI